MLIACLYNFFDMMNKPYDISFFSAFDEFPCKNSDLIITHIQMKLHIKKMFEKKLMKYDNWPRLTETDLIFFGEGIASQLTERRYV